MPGFGVYDPDADDAPVEQAPAMAGFGVNVTLTAGVQDDDAVTTPASVPDDGPVAE